jgi:hypothetical protein
LRLYGTTIERHGDAIKKYLAEWTSDPNEEVGMGEVIYGIAGRTGGKDFCADFFQ